MNISPHVGERVPFRFSVEDDDHSDNNLWIPERTLLLAMLERSFRDLSPSAAHDDRKEAILWFRPLKPPPPIKVRFTFEKTIEILGLEGKFIAFLMHAVDRAEEYEKQRIREIISGENKHLCEGESDRAGTRALSKGKGHPGCAANGAAFGKRRRFRRYG